MQKILLLLLLAPMLAFSQTKYQVNDVVVLRNGRPMQNPWLGGLNNPVFSPMDINQDGLMDLFVYDKAGWKALAFLNTGSVGHPSFTYAPQYDHMFPPDLTDWAVMRDYNHDGIADIFAVTVAGMEVYMGYRAGDFLGYNRTYSNLTFTQGAFAGTVWTFKDNMPVIMDVDGDGDLDILAPDIQGGITLDYYKNVAVDSGYSADSLVFVIGNACQDQAWGGFFEDVNDCGVTLGNCKKGLPLPAGGGVEARHQGGACCGFHYNNTNVVSLVLADLYCNTTKFLENTGSPTLSDVTAYDTIYPRYDVPVNLPLFPCAYQVDADNDGYQDFFFAPFASNASNEGESEDINVVQYYHNIGNDSVNLFHFMGDTFLVNGIVDVGTESHPVFYDYNNDGLMDIVMGSYGQFEPSGFSLSELALYTNIGSDTVPEYTETTLDWNSLSAYQLQGIYPAFGDLSGDGKPDMVVGDATGNLYYFQNTGTVATPYPAMTQSDWFGINVQANAAPFLYDVNGDSLLDLVVGTRNNNIYYYWNFGTRTNPQFSPDSVNMNFGNIKVYDTYVAGTPPGYATPFIQMENGAMVIYSGSQDGYTYKYAVNTDSLRAGTFALIDSNVLGINPGQRSTISIADINHDGINDYLAGNIRGGINLYSDVNWGHTPQISSITEPAQEKPQFAVYPNPARDKVICSIAGNSIRLASATLYDMLGEAIGVPVSSQGNTLVLSVAGIANGIYIVQACDAAGQLYQKKISISK
jgi:hypothetical protein